jgi:hypothetical protein
MSDKKQLNILNVEGIKCDNPKCDYRDDSISWQNMELTIKLFLNKPCPKCACSLLTEEDVRTMRRLAKMITITAKFTDMIPKWMLPKSWKKVVTLHSEMDGTGKCNLRRKNGTTDRPN